MVKLHLHWFQQIVKGHLFWENSILDDAHFDREVVLMQERNLAHPFCWDSQGPIPFTRLSHDDCPIFLDLVYASSQAWLEKLHARLEAIVLYSETTVSKIKAVLCKGKAMGQHAYMRRGVLRALPLEERYTSHFRQYSIQKQGYDHVLYRTL
jgi:hypothetical protein